MSRLTLKVVVFLSVGVGLGIGACSSDSEPSAPPPETTVAEETGADETAAAEAQGEEKPEEPAPEPQPIVASLASIAGKVIVNKKPATAGQELAQGDVVQTKGKKSHADIHMTDGSRIRLGPKAKLQLAKVEKSVSMKLLLGKLYSWITPGTVYEVVTNNAVAGVRGTKFFVEEKKTKSYVCVCEGVVAVKGDKNEEEVLLKAGQDSYAQRKKAGPATESAEKMVNDLNAVFDELKTPSEPSSE